MSLLSISVADQTRHMADRICQLPGEVVASFTCSDPQERMTKLRDFTGEIYSGMLSVISWLERRRPGEKAEMVKVRMCRALDEAIRCAGLEIPEYTGGIIRPPTADPSQGACKTATLAAFVMAFAASLRDWADDIEAEETQRTRPDQASEKNQSGRGRKKRGTTKGDSFVKLVAALSKHHQYADGGCLNFEPINNNELARQAKVDKATASAFFKKAFGGHNKYKNTYCRETARLVASLKYMNDEYTSDLLFGGRLPEEGVHDD